MRRVIAVIAMQLLTACSAIDKGAVLDSACSSFRPLSMSKADTEPTKRQIVGHNRAFDAICPAQGAPAKVAGL